MRTINISNEKARNAQVGFEIKRIKSEVTMSREDGMDYKNVRLLKSTAATTAENLLGSYGDGAALAAAIIESDPEIDIEKVGMHLENVKKIYLKENGEIVYRINTREVVYSPDGEEKAVRDSTESESNINCAIPVRWTGKLIPKSKAIRMFAFTRKYQIKHVNGLTFDFLYDMARQLDEKTSLMLVGGGPKGNAPLVLSNGGTPYHAFLEGRVSGDKYCLILHLTNLELKSI